MPKASQIINRPTWTEYFMQIAELVATRSTCSRRQVGAVIVKDKNILATGYNGTPSGLTHCYEIGCMRDQLNVPSGQRHELCRGIHAEQNAIIQAAKHGVSIAGATLYCTHSCCSLCMKQIINASIRDIVILNNYPDELALEMAREANINIEIITNKS